MFDKHLCFTSLINIVVNVVAFESDKHLRFTILKMPHQSILLQLSCPINVYASPIWKCLINQYRRCPANNADDTVKCQESESMITGVEKKKLWVIDEKKVLLGNKLSYK